MEKARVKLFNKYTKLIENANTSDLDISNSIVDILSELPFDIYDINRKLLKSTLELNEFNNQIKSWESETLSKINDEVDEKEKKIYTNDTIRQAELSKRKVAIIDLIRQRDDIKDELSEIEIFINLLRDIQNNYRNIALIVKNSN